MREIKSAFNTLFVYVVFIACYLPYLISTMILIRNSSQVSSWTAYHATFFFVFLNSSLNPLVYCWRYREIRNMWRVQWRKYSASQRRLKMMSSQRFVSQFCQEHVIFLPRWQQTLMSYCLGCGVSVAWVVFVILNLYLFFSCCYCIVRLSVIICCNFTTKLLYIPFFFPSIYVFFFTFVSLINKKILQKKKSGL